jgi:hypothetical protein
MIALLKSIFHYINADYYEMLDSKDDLISLDDSIDHLSIGDSHSNGCSAIVAIILQNRLYVSSLGDSA